MVRIFASSMKNHSLNTLRGVADPGRRMKTAKASATCASSSTSGMRRATTIEPLKFCKPETQSLLGPPGGPGGGAVGWPEGGVAGVFGGRNRPAGAGEPFSTRPHPAWVSATVPSCDVIASK